MGPGSRLYSLYSSVLSSSVRVLQASIFCFHAVVRTTDQVSRAICSRDISYSVLLPENGNADSEIQYGVMGRKISGGQKPLIGCHYLVSLLETIIVSLLIALSPCHRHILRKRLSSESMHVY